MDRERDIIRIMLDCLTGGEKPGQPYFSTDAESFTLGGRNLLFTTDEFSDEDLFRDHNPEVLGWNLAVATISDIYAAGGTPLFFGQSVSVPPAWNDQRIRDFTNGIATCLEEAKVTFIGGDLGFSDRWHYTGIVIGEARRPISRLGARAGDAIYMTGAIGKGNLEAALKLYSSHAGLKHLLTHLPLRFALRKAESELIREFAGCCIDTSDGVRKALQTIANLNQVGFVVKDLPYLSEGVVATRLLGKPEELLFLAESGEYELLFTLSPDVENDFIKEAHTRSLRFHKTGQITTDRDMVLEKKQCRTDLTKFTFSARDFTDVQSYLDRLTITLKEVKYESCS